MKLKDDKRRLIIKGKEGKDYLGSFTIGVEGACQGVKQNSIANS